MISPHYMLSLFCPLRPEIQFYRRMVAGRKFSLQLLGQNPTLKFALDWDLSQLGMNCLLVPAFFLNYFINLSDPSLCHLKYSRGSWDFRDNYGFWKVLASILPLHFLSVHFYIRVAVVSCPEVISYWESLLSMWCWDIHHKVCFHLKGAHYYSRLA